MGFFDFLKGAEYRNKEEDVKTEETNAEESVEIVFDFDDCYKQLLESVEKLGYQVDKEPGGQLNISRREAV